MTAGDTGQARSTEAAGATGDAGATGAAGAAGARLFSYGTLREPAVQLANFGRHLVGRPDALVGYRLRMVEITDPAVVAVSGSARHPIVSPSGDPSDTVAGTMFEVTADELRAADEYEVDDYARVEVTLASGTRAWVYLDQHSDGRSTEQLVRRTADPPTRTG